MTKQPLLAVVHGDPDDMAVAFRPAEPDPRHGELVVVLQGREAWRARVPPEGRRRLAAGLDEWRLATLREDGALTHEDPHGAPFELGRALAGFPGLSLTRHGAWFMVEGPGASAGVHVLSCVRTLRDAVADLAPSDGSSLPAGSPG